MLIRPLTPEDETFLWEALYYAVYVGPGEPARPPEIVRQSKLARYVLGWMTRADDLGFKAEQDGVPVGAAWLRRWSGDEQGYGFVDRATPELSMSILPQHRGRGVGTLLLRYLLSAAEKRFTAVSLSVSESNPARRLYEREGFIPVGEPEGGSITMVRKSIPGEMTRSSCTSARDRSGLD